MRRWRLSLVLLIGGYSVALLAVGMGLQRFMDGDIQAAVAASAPADRQAGDVVDAALFERSSGQGAGIPGAKPLALAATEKNPARAVAIHIPRLKVSRSLVSLQVLEDKSLSVPKNFDDIGWWSHGPRPGGPGSTLVAGHVSRKSGPAVFYHLKNMRVGDRVTLDRADRTSAVFVVVGKASYSRSAFPDDVVYRTVGKPSVHLVTCDGLFNTAIGHHQDNLVVFADLVSSGPTKKASATPKESTKASATPKKSTKASSAPRKPKKVAPAGPRKPKKFSPSLTRRLG